MAQIAKKTKRYPSDLTDEEWDQFAPLMPKLAGVGVRARLISGRLSTPCPTLSDPAVAGGCCRSILGQYAQTVREGAPQAQQVAYQLRRRELCRRDVTVGY